MNKKSDFYLSRINYPPPLKGGIYYVRISTRMSVTGEPAKLVAKKGFKDADYGGKRKAKIAAKLWRDKRCKELNLWPGMRENYRPHRKHQNNTGHVGISMCCQYRELAHGSFAYYYNYQVSWREGEKRDRTYRTKAFSFKDGDEYGKEQALERAIKWRKKMEKLHYHSL